VQLVRPDLKVNKGLKEQNEKQEINEYKEFNDLFEQLVQSEILVLLVLKVNRVFNDSFELREL
jgi:hypothetical protein